MNTLKDRLETAVNNIMSGDNRCGTLANAAYNSDRDYFRRAVRPVVVTYEEEAEELRRQRDFLLRDIEEKRFALESVLANLAVPTGPVRDAMTRAMPGHPLLKGS